MKPSAGINLLITNLLSTQYTYQSTIYDTLSNTYEITLIINQIGLYQVVHLFNK
jgi:hypothetical protein